MGSVVVGLERLERPSVDVGPDRLFRIVDAGFAERRKTIRSVVVRLGVDPGRADDLLRERGIEPRARAERLSLQDFSSIAEMVP